MEKQEDIIARLKNIFDSFLAENFSTNNNVYFDKLITHLAAKDNVYILQSRFALEWVDKCLTIIREDFSKVHPKVISFMLNFCSLLMLNEWVVIEIREHRILDKILLVIESNSADLTPSMKLGTIRVLTSALRYSLALAYIRTTKAWRFLLECCNKDHTLYVVREARQLLYEVLYKYSVKTNDEQIVLEILNEIFRPLHENVFQADNQDNIMINVDEPELQHKLGPTVDLLAYIFERTLDAEEKTNLVALCNQHHDCKFLLWKYVEMTVNNKQFTEKLMRAHTAYNFANLVYEKWHGGVIAPEDCNRFGVLFLNLMKFCINRQDFINFMKLAELNYILWKKLGTRAPKEIQIEHERVQMENQIIMFHMIPLCMVQSVRPEGVEELFDNYVMKLFEISCEQVQRMCYFYRDQCVNAKGVTDPAMADVAYKCIHSILSMDKVLDRTQAVLVFQTMVYVFTDYVKFIYGYEKAATDGGADAMNSNHSTSVEHPHPAIIQMPHVLHASLIGLQTLIKRYRITWKDSIETICLVNCVLYYLKNEDIPSRSVVQALKLEQLAIEHFLSPNMALLIDNLKGSGLVYLGPIIVKRCHDTNWEVRDSTLELVTSVANISRLKFPAFQKYLADHNICAIVFGMAKNDIEPYVRASALKCLWQMVSINIIWDKDLSKKDLIEHLFSVLCNDSEGMVRKEAVCVLTKIYDQRRIPKEYLDCFYSTLAHSVIADLHWEVKVCALHFWELEIEKQFSNQGMIDGTFPTVTFSKEHKKIVTLTEKEINLRIKKVFNELSQRGCLGIILKCLDEDCDFQVIKTAVCIMHRLMEKLRKYDYEAILSSMETMEIGNEMQVEVAVEEDEVSAMTEATSNCSIPATPPMESYASSHADEIIESILSGQDINFVLSAFERVQVNGTVEAQHVDEQYYKTFANVGPKDFVTAIKRIDLDELVRNQKEWFLGSESFVSLLDDIAFEIKPHDDAIFADCY